MSFRIGATTRSTSSYMLGVALVDAAQLVPLSWLKSAEIFSISLAC